jgi:hypothetical protein
MSGEGTDPRDTIARMFDLLVEGVTQGTYQSDPAGFIAKAKSLRDELLPPVNLSEFVAAATTTGEVNDNATPPQS